MPGEFWSLTPREFWIKHAAWVRANDRAKADIIDLTLRTAGHRYKERDRSAMRRAVNALRRYPVKKWVVQPSE